MEEPEKTPRARKEPTFAMSKEVHDWIEQAHAQINYLKGEVDRLKNENKNLKDYKKWAEHRILSRDNDD